MVLLLILMPDLSQDMFVIANPIIGSFYNIPLPAVRFDRLTVLSLPKEERAGVRGRTVHTHLDLPPARGKKSKENVYFILAIALTFGWGFKFHVPGSMFILL